MEFDIIQEARSIFDKEIAAIEATRDALGGDFEKMVDAFCFRVLGK